MQRRTSGQEADQACGLYCIQNKMHQLVVRRKGILGNNLRTDIWEEVAFSREEPPVAALC